MIVFQLLKKEVPVVAYIDNDTLSTNLMNTTVPSIPEIGYRYREVMHNGMVASVWLVSGMIYPAGALTKVKPKNMLREAIVSGYCKTPAKSVFMLQTNPFRHVSWMPTSKVPMPDDHEAPRDEKSK